MKHQIDTERKFLEKTSEYWGLHLRISGAIKLSENLVKGIQSLYLEKR